MNFQFDITILNQHSNQQKSKLNKLFIEMQEISLKLALISKDHTQSRNLEFLQKQKILLQKKKSCSLFSKFRTEIIINFTMFLNVKQILLLRQVNKLFNQIICQSLPARINQYKNILENIQNSLNQIPTIINIIPEQTFIDEDLFIDWDLVWNYREIAKIYSAKELESNVYQILRFMYISIYPDFPETITLEQFKKMLSRPYLRYDVPQSNQILTEKQINALQDVMLLDVQQIKVQYKFLAYICQLLQNYIRMTKSDAFKIMVQKLQLQQKENQISQRLSILNKLNHKLNN
ncbi:unnamed protein product [Paramecium sonneborni]|uniref:Uncharacterized protein n=1 Tax=Paramecium sonneborni TaxID=65129 RepID=A0A8S1PRY2_9CILI|nr:unnamed protein product [Paramecium sonneborni]